MDGINDLYNIINNNYDNQLNNNIDNIYQQILDTEENVRNTIDRVIELKDNEKLNSLFTKKSVENVALNIFKILNTILEEINNTDNITYKQLKKIIKKDSRLIYIGIFFIALAVSLLLIEITSTSLLILFTKPDKTFPGPISIN